MKIKQKITGLALIVASLTGHAQTNESVVNWEADIAGLSALSANDIPKSGTFWLVTPPNGNNGGMMPPYPCLPSSFNSGNIYTLPSGAFLVDATGGNDGTNTAQLAAQMLSVSNVIQQAETVATSHAMGMRAMDLSGPLGFNDTNGDGYTPDDVTNPPIAIDYGTNLWIAQWNQISNNVTGIASNTIADISYELMTNSDLTTTNWGHSGQFILGSEATNWTALNSFAVSLTNNLFFRLLSYVSSDGSGLPDWWELEYFGTTGIDPYGDPAGDGYSNLYKYQHGLNPNVFYQPAAPQGLTATYNAGNSTATITWLPSPGNVTGYTLTTPGGTVNLPATAISYADIDPNIATSLNSIFNSYPTSFSLVADYAPGNSASATAQLLTTQPAAWLVQGAQGSNFLVVAVSALPPGTTAIRWVHFDIPVSSFSGSNDIPLTSFTNGIYYLPPALTTAPADGSGLSGNDVIWSVQTVNATGAATSPLVRQGYSTSLGDGRIVNASTFQLLNPVYLDGRVQLQQNLKFLLRAAMTDNSFGYYDTDPASGYADSPRMFATNYAEASFYEDTYLDGIWPNKPALGAFHLFQDNYLYENCVFNPLLLQGGQLTTGVFPEDAYGGADGYLIFSGSPAYTFNPPTASSTPVPALGPDQATWLMTGANSFDPDYQYEIGLTNANNTNTMLAGIKNIYGLPLDSIKAAWNDENGNPQTQTLYPGDSTTQSAWFYPQTAQPQLQTVEYDFWNYNYGYYDGNGNWNPIDVLPEESGFSPTNQSDNFLIASVGSTLQVAGYAKMAVTNGYSGTYGYVGQYFTNAYVIDTNGMVTTNTTGILSPYGAFFPTEPGPVALVTMPDPDTGEHGTCTVYAVSLVLDKNHDLKMDTSFSGQDATSVSSPMEFWINNNYDRWTPDEDDGTNYMDDVQVQGCPAYPNTATPDYNYSNVLANGYAYRAIPCTRDLEDFARLWVCGITTNLLAALPSGSTVTLSWGDVGSPNSANPTIDLFAAADTDGGIGYLTNETIAAEQTNILQGRYVGRLGPGQSIQLNASQFANDWAGNYFIWCGVSNGTGGLNLTIQDGNSNVLAQTTAYLQIQDIKLMYERWTVGDQPNNAPTNAPYLATENLPPFASAFQYTPPQDANTPYILLVHGWNDPVWAKDRFAECAFKRLYWQGYQGRFGEFRWPTTYLNPTKNPVADDITLASIYDPGEYNAWRSADGLLNKLQDLNSQYSGHVYMLAHSMGNVVAGEALRLAAQSGSGQIVNTYVATQAAVPGHCYDSTLSGSDLLGFEGGFLGPTTANIYNDWLTTNSAAAGAIINFYNTNDYALNSIHWQLDEELKPDSVIGLNPPYGYNGSPGDNPPLQDGFYSTTILYPFQHTLYLGNENTLQDRYEITAFAAEPRSLAMGNINMPALTKSIDLTTVWLSDPSGHNYADHFWHSAEFRGDSVQMWSYWSELLGSEAFKMK